MQQLLEEAHRAAALAQKLGAQDARIRIDRARYAELKQSRGEIEAINSSVGMKLNAQLYVDGRYSSHSTSDLRPAALEQFFKKAVALTRYLAPDPHRKLPEPSRYTPPPALELDIFDPEFERFSLEARKTQLTQLEGFLAQASFKVIHTSVGSFDELSELAIVNTNGFEGYQQETEHSFGVDITAEDPQGKLVQGGDFVRVRLNRQVPALETLAKSALQRTGRNLGARPIKTRTLPMLLENRVTGRLIGNMLGPMQGYALQQRQSFLEGKKGQAIASTALSLLDEPHLVGGLSSRFFDDEGLPTQKRVLVDKGILQDYVLDVYYASKLKLVPTGGSVSNPVIPPGTRTLEELMKAADTGILVTGFLGGNSNGTTGDFSLGINGLYFEKGQVVQPVQEMNIAGNQLDVWKRLQEVGSDPFMYGNARLPSLLFADMVFSGV